LDEPILLADLDFDEHLGGLLGGVLEWIGEEGREVNDGGL
jgi:hypothetical protein